MKTPAFLLIFLSGCIVQKSDCKQSTDKTITLLNIVGVEMACIQPSKYGNESLEYYKCVNEGVRNKLK